MTRDQYVAAASAALALHGPYHDGNRLPATAVARIAGVSRSTLYQRWDSMTVLGQALLEYRAVERPGWRDRLLGQPPDQPLAASIEAALDADPTSNDVVARAIVATLPSGHPVRVRTAAAERADVDRLGPWLVDHLATIGRRPAAPVRWDHPRTPITGADLAVVLDALVEGHQLQVGPLSGWDPHLAARSSVGDEAQRLVTHLSMPGTGPDPVAEPDAQPHVPPVDHRFEARDVALFEALIADGPPHVPDLTGDRPPVRLVDLARLARQLGVTERRLYGLWPSASDLNLDLVRHQFRVDRTEIDRRVLSVMSATLAFDGDCFAAIFMAAIEGILGIGLESISPGLFACAFATSDVAVAATAAREMAEWHVSVRTMLLATMQSIGFHLAPGVSADSCTHAVFSGFIGSTRAALLDPTLLHRTIAYGDDDQLLLAAGLEGLLRAQTARCRHDS